MKLLFSDTHNGYKACTATEELDGQQVGVIRLYRYSNQDMEPIKICTIYKDNTSKLKLSEDFTHLMRNHIVKNTFVSFMQEFGQYDFPTTTNIHTIRRYLAENYGITGLEYSTALESRTDKAIDRQFGKKMKLS